LKQPKNEETIVNLSKELLHRYSTGAADEGGEANTMNFFTVNVKTNNIQDLSFQKPSSSDLALLRVKNISGQLTTRKCNIFFALGFIVFHADAHDFDLKSIE